MTQGASLHYTIYADRLFLEYLIIFTLLMILFGMLTRRKMQWKRLFLFAVLWSAASIGCLFFPASVRRWGSTVIESLMGLLFFCLLYGRPHKRTMGGVFLVLFLVLMYLTGCFQIAYRLERWSGIRGSRLLTAGLLALLLVIWMLRQNGKRLYRVRFSYHGEECMVMALLDTGNFLREPVSGKAVCVVEQDSIPWKNCIESEGLFMIPYHAVGKDDGVLPAVKVTQVEINDSEGVFFCQEMLLAVYHGKFSEHGKYQMLLHPDYLKGRNGLC